MNCTPQNLATLSSALRALTDGQLSQIKTFLFCRWAQLASNTPKNLDITALSTAANITVIWTNPSQPTTNEVWKSTDGINFVLFASVAGSVNQVTDSTGLGAGNFFYYKVRACSATCSPFSNIISAVTTYVSANVASISFPTLVRSFGLPTSFKADTLAALTSVSLPALKRADGNLDLANNPNLTSVNLNALQTVNTALFLGSNNLTGPLSLPALVSTGADFQTQSNPLLTSISCPSMTTCAGILQIGANGGLTSVSFPLLSSIGSQLFLQSDTSLTSISFPSLTTILGSVTGNLCTVLQSVNIPLATFANGTTITFNADALNGASVNLILRRGVVSGVTTCDFELGAGTNAAPSGQGVADKATLIGAGNTVNTN